MPEEHPISLRFPKQLKADLVKFAKAQGCSLNWLMNDIARKWIEWKKKQVVK